MLDDYDSFDLWPVEVYMCTAFFLSFLYEVARARDDACLTGWPNARPPGWDKCNVARHHQACLKVYVMYRCCATSLFEREVCKA